MKTKLFLNLIISLSGLSLAACGGPGKNLNAEQIPSAMDCPASQDPSQGCPTPSQPAVTLGQKAPRPSENSGSSMAGNKKLRSIEGRCELWVGGEKEARPCDGLKLQVRSTRAGELRDGVVSGYAVSFTDLTQDSYRLIASSDIYTLTTDKKPLEAGQKVVLRIKGKAISP